MSQSPCPTCGCTLYREYGDCKGAGLLRSALTAVEVLRDLTAGDPVLKKLFPGLPRIEKDIREAIK